jgi:hypothetical protein
MRLNHATLRRPAYWLALSLALVAVPLLAACGTTAQAEPAAPATDTASASPPSSESQTHDSQSNPGNGSGSTTASNDARVINLAIANRDTALTREDLRVTQGDTVRLKFTADEHGEIHLHGYDLTAEVSPGHPGQLEFIAENAGAFGINFHVFAAGKMEDDNHSGEHGHNGGAAETLVSEAPVGVSITAEVDARGAVDVGIDVEGMRFAPELVDQAHTVGVGHAHIYVDGEKLGRVFESSYRIENLPPGDHEIRVSLNTNDHRELVYDGRVAEDTVTVTVPDVGQGSASDGHSQDGHHTHDGHDHGDAQEIVAEVHLGNLEVYP